MEKLRGELVEFEYTLDSLQSREDYEAFFGKLATRVDPDEEHDPTCKEIIKRLKQIAGQLRVIVNECLESKEALWLLGM